MGIAVALGAIGFGVSNGALANSGHLLTITDVTVNEGDVATFAVTLSPPPDRRDEFFTVELATVDDSATGGDYGYTSATIGFAKGQPTTRTFTVQTGEDSVQEQSETFKVRLLNARAVCIQIGSSCRTSVTANDTGIGTISDDDAPVPPAPPAPDLPKLSISDVTSVTRQSDCVLTVALSAASAAPVSAQWAATGSVDQLGGATNGELQFAPGTTVRQITLDVVKLRRHAGAVNIALSNPSGATIDDAFGMCTVASKRKHH